MQMTSRPNHPPQEASAKDNPGLEPELGFISRDSFNEACQDLAVQWQRIDVLGGEGGGDIVNVRLDSEDEHNGNHYLTITRTLFQQWQPQLPSPSINPTTAASEQTTSIISSALATTTTTNTANAKIPSSTSDEGEEEDELAIHHTNHSNTYNLAYSSSPSSRSSSSETTIATTTVTYNIVYSPSYCVPVLYVFLHNLPLTVPTLPKSTPSSISESSPSSHPRLHRRGGTEQNLDTIYTLLVPKHHRRPLRDVSVLGGVSLTNHPITDLSCYWVHPCNTAPAMADLVQHTVATQSASSPTTTTTTAGLSPRRPDAPASTNNANTDVNGDIDNRRNGTVGSREYMMLWLGLAGGAVGLSLPREMALV